MNRISHLQKSLIVIVLVLALSIGNPIWWLPVSTALYIYYFLFALSLYIPIYHKENRLTRMFFGTTEMPMYFAMAMFAFAILYVKRMFPDANVASLYINGLVGAAVTLIARYKRGKLGRKAS